VKRSYHQYDFLLLVGFALACFAGYLESDVQRWGASLTSNIAAGFFGAWITWYLIDRTTQKRADDAKARSLRAVLELLRPVLLRHLGFLRDMYKASAVSRPPKNPTNFTEMFSLDFYGQIHVLDFRKPSRTLKPITWQQRSQNEINDFRTKISDILDKYAMHLGPDFLALLSKISSDLNHGLIIGLLPALFHGQAAVMPRFQSVDGNYVEPVERHITTLLELIDLFNEYAADLITIETIGVWAENTEPMWGSARLDGVA
jgi:hypothetical protein